MTKQRLGRFYIDADVIEGDFESARKIMSHFVVTRCEYLYHRRAFEYIAISDLFKPVELYTKLPLYNILIADEEIRVELVQ